MTDTRVARGPDRLPWLTDQPKQDGKPRKGGQPWIGSAAAVLLVAGAAYLFGTQKPTGEPENSISPRPSGPSVTLPRAQSPKPPADVQIAPTPEVRPAPTPQVSQSPRPIVRPLPQSTVEAIASEQDVDQTTKTVQPDEAKPSAADAGTNAQSSKAAATQATEAMQSPPLASARSLKYWPSRVTDGASGRVVQIGAFGSSIQAKRGWWHMARAYPGVKRLPAVVVEARNSRGRPLYRFQIGTTSQAHSEVLCQRMQKIQFSCAVVGLPWKPKGVER
jgi:outer membrane biosynthesis protein TonB